MLIINKLVKRIYGRMFEQLWQENKIWNNFDNVTSSIINSKCEIMIIPAARVPVRCPRKNNEKAGFDGETCDRLQNVLSPREHYSRQCELINEVGISSCSRRESTRECTPRFCACLSREPNSPTLSNAGTNCRSQETESIVDPNRSHVRKFREKGNKRNAGYMSVSIYGTHFSLGSRSWNYSHDRKRPRDPLTDVNRKKVIVALLRTRIPRYRFHVTAVKKRKREIICHSDRSICSSNNYQTANLLLFW